MNLTTNNRVIVCTHKDFAHQKSGVDFSELWAGGVEEHQRNRGSKWHGAFRARPYLADQLVSVLRKTTANVREKSLLRSLSECRQFFRFLDAYETWAAMQENTKFQSAVNGVEDITTHHLQLWKTPSPGGEWRQAARDAYKSVCSLIRKIVNSLGLPPLIIPAHSHPDYAKDNPGDTIGQLLVLALARRAVDIYKHWDRSDLLALKGRDLIDVKRTTNRNKKETVQIEGGITEADLHATYRSAVRKNGDLPINLRQFLLIFGYGDGLTSVPTLPIWWPFYHDGPNKGRLVYFSDLQWGLYPQAEHTAVLFLLFLARSGWNQATAEMLDISKEENWCKEYAKRHTWLFAFKHRSNDWQETVSITQQRTGAYQIIKTIIARTEPLRRASQLSPSLSENYIISERSPWIYSRTNQPDQRPVRVEVSSAQLGVVLRLVIKAHNKAQENPDKRIPDNLAPGDLRDIFAAFSLVNSDFSLFVTQMALGHKNSVVTFNYLRRRAWRAESEKKKNTMFVALIDQIETHRVIDLTLLRAQMDGITVTQEMIERLNSYRTYSGMGCTDPTHPPKHIDPTNPCDGTTSCAQGHLCPGCPKARTFNDSLPHLARRCAELDWLSDTLPLEVFQGSSLADQLLVLRATLKQWPGKEVENLLRHWTTQISNGSHKPIRFAGEH